MARKTTPKTVNEDKIELAKQEYNRVSGWDDIPRDKDGFIRLQFTAQKNDERLAELTTDISSLEEKLKKYKEEKAKKEKYQETKEYKESKKQVSKKKQKKKKESLLAMVFNNADAMKEEETENEEEDGGKLVDKKPKAEKKKKPSKADTTLDTTYGKRFSPVVSMLHDTITEFDQIADEIEEDLKNSRNTSRTMYRSSQIGNLISAKNSKLSAVKELASVAKTVSDLEYKKEKDRKDAEGSDSSREISSFGARYLRGSFDIFDAGKKDKDKKKKDKDKSDKKSSGKSKGKAMLDEDDDEDYDAGSIKSSKYRPPDGDENSEQEMAMEFFKALENNKDDIKFTPAERFVSMEGKYTIKVAADPLDVENTWRFVPISNKTGKEIPEFKEKYPGLLPRKRKCRMKFDLNRMKATDLNTSKTYKLILT